jgi:hypothetical protein
MTAALPRQYSTSLLEMMERTRNSLRLQVYEEAGTGWPLTYLNSECVF